MKKIISFILVAILCLGALTSCELGDKIGGIGDKIGGFFSGLFGGEEEGPTVEQAASYLDSIYKTTEGNTDTADYDVVAKVILDGSVEFTVTWTVSNSGIVIKASGETGYYTVDLPASNDAVSEYTLTATVKDADGNTANYTLNRKLGVYQAKVEVDDVTALKEGVAYKFYLTQNDLRKHLFATHEIDSQGKYYVTTESYTEAPDFFAEKVEGGYKFFTMIGGANKYVNAYLVEDGKTDKGETKYSKRLNYADTTTNVWYYDSDAKCWCVTLNGSVYGIGTYGTFDTFSISDYSYFTSGKSEQFPAGFVTADQAAALPSFPELSVKDAPEVNKGYHIVTQNKNGDIYFNGTVVGGRFGASADKANAVVVFVKAGANAGEYILCLYINNVANYVVMADESKGCSLTTTASEATVFEWNETKATMAVALDSNNRAFGSDSTKDYENMSAYALPGNAEYRWGAFQLVEGATEPANPSAPPAEPDDGGDDVTPPSTDEPSDSANVEITKDNLFVGLTGTSYATYNGEHTLGNLTITTSNVLGSTNGEKNVLQFRKENGVLTVSNVTASSITLTIISSFDYTANVEVKIGDTTLTLPAPADVHAAGVGTGVTTDKGFEYKLYTVTIELDAPLTGDLVITNVTGYAVYMTSIVISNEA